MSVHRLAAEIIQIIASYVDGKRAPYTVICRSWQAAFERQIYSALDVKLTSGAPYRVARRSIIRKLTYWAIIPFYLEDYTSRALDDYTIDNEVRWENNQAFTNAIKRLFDFLHA